jgi:hypothetical protein
MKRFVILIAILMFLFVAIKFVQNLVYVGLEITDRVILVIKEEL